MVDMEEVVVAEDMADTAEALALVLPALWKDLTASATTVSATKERSIVPDMGMEGEEKEDMERTIVMEVWRENTAIVIIVNVRMGLDRTAMESNVEEVGVDTISKHLCTLQLKNNAQFCCLLLALLLNAGLSIHVFVSVFTCIDISIKIFKINYFIKKRSREKI